jgi:hypothetical protein
MRHSRGKCINRANLTLFIFGLTDSYLMLPFWRIKEGKLHGYMKLCTKCYTVSLKVCLVKIYRKKKLMKSCPFGCMKDCRIIFL